MPRDSLIKLLLVFTAFAVGLGFRLMALQDRPFHGDEANQAMKAGVLLETGRYEYDPHEHHGPTLYYAALPVMWVCGVQDVVQMREWMFRLVPALCGAALILLMLLVPGLGAWEAGVAAWLLALSHAMVYYSRYAIQESMFVFFAFGAMVCLWRWVQRPGWGWAMGCGVFLGLTHASKETSAVLFVAMGIAAAVTWYTLRPIAFERAHVRHAGLVVACALLVSVTLFSAFGTHWRGPLDSILTYTSYLHRSSGEGSSAMHDKPWWYYFATLAYTHRSAGPVWSEGFALVLATAGVLWGVCSRRWVLRFLGVYALVVTLVYTLIPYKTPWNLLPFWQPALVLGGCFAGWLLWRGRAWWMRAIVAIGLLAGLSHAARQSYHGNFVYAADVRNPYVYAHTSTALMRLVKRVEEIAEEAPDGTALHINVLKPDADYWPLPWYLRGYERVGYWTQPPDNADADIIIADSGLGDFVQGHTSGEYQFEYHGLRPDVPLLVFIRKPLWDAFMETRR